MAINQSRLTPQEQSLLFQLSQKAGTQPGQGGAPAEGVSPQDPTLRDLAPQQDAGALPPPTGKMSPEEFMQTIAPRIAQQGQMQQPQAQQPPAQQPPAQQPQGLSQLAPQQQQNNYAPKLVAMKGGGLGMKVKSDIPVYGWLGGKETVPVSSTNYYDTIVNMVGEQTAKALLPGNTPVQPDGKPFVSEKMLANLDGFLKVPKASEQDKPNPALGKMALTTLEKRYGKDSPQYQNAKDYLDSAGGISLNKFGDFTRTATDEETPNFVKGANGIVQRYDRATNSFKDVPGQTTGALSVLGDPASMNMFNTRLQDFQSDTVVKGLKTTLDNLSNASAMLESNNPASIGVFFSNVAKSIGKEAGVLTEGDIQRSVGDPGIAAQLYRWYNKKADILNGKGQFSEKDLKDFRGLIRDLGASADSRYESALSRHVGATVKTLPGLTPDFVKGAFDTGSRFQPSKERRLPGQATNYETKTEGVTKSGVKYKVIE